MTRGLALHRYGREGRGSRRQEARPRYGGQMHWSQREIAKEVGLSQPTIHRIWKSFGLQLYR